MLRLLSYFTKFTIFLYFAIIIVTAGYFKIICKGIFEIFCFMQIIFYYCFAYHALLLGLPKNLLQKLQYVQNSAARLIMGTNKRDHIRPVLKKLHWLPIDNRIVFKILLLTFKARAKLAPQYIQDLINDYTPQRNLRSGSKCLLETPNFNLESYGKRAFSVAAPRLWNSLPMELKTSTSIDIFKKKLKTYLFKQSYF